jgi:enterobacterial common antigen flippase
VEKTISSSQKALGAKTFISTFGTTVFMQGCMIFQGVLLARLLDPIGRGEYSSILLWPMVLGNIGLFGISASITRIAAREQDLAPLVRTALLLALISGFITAFIGYWLLPVLIPVEKHNILPLARLFLLFIIIYHLTANFFAIDQGSGNFFRLNIFRSMDNPFRIMLLIMIALLGFHNLIWFVGASLLSYAFIAFGRTFSFLREYPLWGKIYSPVRILKESVSFGLVEIGKQGYQYIDQILLLWLLDPEKMGLYVIALSASSLIGCLPSSIGLVAFTITAQMTDTNAFLKIAILFRKTLVIMLVGGTVLALTMPFILPFVYGRDFKNAVLPAIILIGGSAFAGLSLLLDQCLRGQGRPFVGLVGRVAAIGTMILVGYPASRLLGTSGIAIAFVCAQFVCLLVILGRVLFLYENARLVDLIPGRGDIWELAGLIGRWLGRAKEMLGRRQPEVRGPSNV